MNIYLLPALMGSSLRTKSSDNRLIIPTYLDNITDGIHQDLCLSLKHTPFITITRLTGPMDQIIPRLINTENITPPSANLLIAVGLNASTDDGRYHTAQGWSVCNNTSSKASSHLAECLTTAALRILGRRAFSMPGQIPSQRHLSQTALLSVLPIPAVLTLNLYQDNRQDIEYLLSDVGRQAIIKLHTKGIMEYLSLNP